MTNIVLVVKQWLYFSGDHHVLVRSSSFRQAPTPRVNSVKRKVVVIVISWQVLYTRAPA